MSLNGLSWADTSACDIHLLPGLVSPELKRLLRPNNFNSTTGETVEDTFSNMPGVKVSFAAQFNGAPDNHGVKMNPDTGQVTVAAALPAGPRLRSFIITATAKEGTTTVTNRIRVNIHESISRIWLTPAQLTVRKGAKNMRLSVLAQFDDLTIGDITNWSPFTSPGGVTDFTYVHSVAPDTPLLSWSAESVPAGGASVVSVDSVTGELTASADTGKAKITVKLLNKSASAMVLCAKAWSTPTTLTLVSGPGDRRAGFVPNFLFLPDGFQEKEKTEFERLVRFVVGRLSSRNRTRPFSALGEKVNYYYGWVPSPDAGVSVLDELDRTVLSPTTADGSSLEFPSPGRGPTGKWSLENLINEVGLPISTADTTISDLGQPRIDAWQKLYGNQVTKARVQDVFRTWLLRNDRVIVNERDTGFHMAFGTRPALDSANAGHSLSFNPRRLADDDFDIFLKNLRGPTGLSLLDLWSAKGKDSKFIVFLCRSKHLGGGNTNRPSDGAIVGVSLGDKLTHRLENNKLGDGLEITPDPIPSDPTYDIWLTVAHELGHSCNLGDEYGGDASAPTQARIASTVAKANLQDRASLLAGSDLSTDKLKWKDWPRIAKAGVLLDNPKPKPDGKFALVLENQKASRLKTGDIVRLRTRPLAKALPPTNRFKVESVTDAEMIIAPLFTGSVLDPAKFPRGSIVMMPVRGPDSDPAAKLFGPDLPLVDEATLTRIAETGNPLNAQPLTGEAPAPNDASGRPCKSIQLKLPTGATNFPNRKAPNPPIYSSWTIGIFENGARHNCGVFRPTGVCLMSQNANVDPKTNTDNLYDFCLICRYAIIDELDPTLHEAVEIDFVGRYGKRGAQ